MASYSNNDGVKTLAITSSVSINDFDTVALRAALTAMDSLAAGVALSGGILTLTLADERVVSFTLSGTSIRISLGAGDPLSYTFTAAAINGVYTGTVSVTANSLVGRRAIITGFETAANNGSFIVTDNNGSTTLTVNNAASEAETHEGFAALGSKSDLFELHELTKILAFVQAAAAAINAYTATVFTVTYA